MGYSYMANTSSIRGLVPVRSFARSGFANPIRRYSVPASYATALFIGDPVIKTGTSDADGYSEVNSAANGGFITGVVVGFEDVASLQLGYGAASTVRAVLVDDDPESLFEIQEDAVGGTLALASVGLNADLISAAGSTYTRASGWQLDTSTAAVTATLQVKIVEFQHRVDNEPASASAKLLVKINKHTELAAVVGI
jgi:hypothetical protein